MTRLYILKTGDAASEVSSRHGDYDAMFLAHLTGLDLDIQVVDAFRRAPLPELDALDAAIITGSPESVTKPEPWTEDLAAWCRAAHTADVPVLGVCYGHQLLAYAHGGAVEVSGKGFEIGTVSVDIGDEAAQDPLFRILSPGPSDFHSVHGDEVVRLPEDATVLARSPHSAVQAFRLGAVTWGVQFHPEFTDDIMKVYVDARETLVRRRAEAVGRDPDGVIQTARAGVRPTPAGPRLLHRFIEWVREASPRTQPNRP